MTIKRVTAICEQIDKLRIRGLTITSEDKAKEILYDIGYYRLGFYLFPFEESYPKHINRTHKYKEGATLENAIALYYFDFDLRHILIRYLTRIEIAFRTELIYSISYKYKESPTWFVDKSIVKSEYADSFEEKYYTSLKKKIIIARHHKKYINDKFAPAWKTIEFMTLGEINILYKNLKHNIDRSAISKRFGVNKVSIFENYLETIRVVRNLCAHGNVLFDMRLQKSVKNGPAIKIDGTNGYSLNTEIAVISYLLRRVSENRNTEMLKCIEKAMEKAEINYSDIRQLIKVNLQVK